MGKEQVLLQATGIYKEFPGVKALTNASFSLKAGEIHALLGENGAGKSTLIKVLTGVEHKDQGTIYFDGKSINPKNTQDAQHIGISTVYQEVNLCPNLSVAENIYIGRQLKKHGMIDWKAMNKNAEEMLKRFKLDIDVTKRLDDYSVAIQQMVAIARAVDISAKVLILDEPTSSLSTHEVEKLFEIMLELKAEGIGIVFVTHFLDQVYEVCDTITVLRNGEYVGIYETQKLPRVELIAKMLGKAYEELDQLEVESEQTSKKKEALIQLKNIVGSNQLDDVCVDVNKGEALGLSGLLGSGRSEIARTIFGIDQVLTGEITLKGQDAHIHNPITAIRSDIAFCPEDRKKEGIVGDLSIRENIILALQAKRGMFKKISRAEANQLCEKYIKLLSIKTPSGDQKIKNLSGGNQQKVILARALATNPSLLMLDEPTRGIDIGTKTEIQKLVIKLAGEGMAVIFISSELDEMLRSCSRIIILRDKKIVGELEGDDISDAKIMEYIAGGGSNEQA